MPTSTSTPPTERTAMWEGVFWRGEFAGVQQIGRGAGQLQLGKRAEGRGTSGEKRAREGLQLRGDSKTQSHDRIASTHAQLSASAS